MILAHINQTLQAKIFERLEKDPTRKTIMFYNANRGSNWYSFEGLYQSASGYAQLLLDSGLGKGGVCIIVLPSGELSAMLLTATLLLGGVPLLVAPPSLQAEGAFSSLLNIIERIIGKTRPDIVVLPDSMAEMRKGIRSIKGKPRRIFTEGEVTPIYGAKIPITVPGEDDIAAMQLTSGTTGFPRVCVWKQRNVIAALDGMSAAMDISEYDTCLNWTPLYHDMGLVNNFFTSVTRGVPLVMLNPNEFVKDPSLWLRSLSETGATVTWSPNFGFAITAQRVKDRDLEGVRLDQVRGFWNAAEKIHYETMKAFHKRFEAYGVRYEALKTNFGCAENIGGATFSDPKGAFLVEHLDRKSFLESGVANPVENSSGEGEVVSIVGAGKPHPGIRISILSKKGKQLPDGCIGELALDTPSRMQGYLNDARATRRALFGKYLRTGDMGYMRGDQFFWVGRVKERITVRGVKLDPSDFERILLQIPGLRHGNFAAFGVDDEKLGTQRIVLVSEVRNSNERNPDEISSDIRNRVFLQLGVNINDVVLVNPDTLTKTSSGKRRHRFFRKLYLEGNLEEFRWLPASVKDTHSGS